jgi:hypothetical protein
MRTHNTDQMEKGKGECNYSSSSLRGQIIAKGKMGLGKRQRLALPVIVGVPDNSPAPLERTSAVGLPRGAASGLDTVEKLGSAEYL